jgi:hypothetical protein
MSGGGVVLRPHRGVPGVSRTSLWKSWKEIRKKLRDSSLRDVIDWVEFDLEPEKWIRQLLADVNDGRYEPRRPTRFALGKSKGLSRWMTLPSVPDLVLFHALATRIVERAQRRRRKYRHVYFMRDRISAVQKKAEEDARTKMSTDPHYRTGFYVWLRLHQYRRYLVFKRVYKHVVVTDISNFFDSVVYTQLEASLFELGIARNVVGLLFLILERLSIRDAYTALPRIGLPVDEFDCSRCLAHVVLFPHDDRMIDLVGENAYVRWMDDQTFGVNTEAEAYRLLAHVNTSLRRIHLVPNAGKTKILTLGQARRHFHFDLNDRLDKIDKLCDPKGPASSWRKGRAALRDAWKSGTARQGDGEWGKILKRFYRNAGFLRLRLLVGRAQADILQDPALSERIMSYLRLVCTPPEFINRALAILADERLVYDDARRAVAEEFLRLEPTTQADRTRLRQLAARALQGMTREIPIDLAALMLLRFGDERTDRTLLKFLESHPQVSDARSVGFVLASKGAARAGDVRKIAERELEGPLRTVARFADAVDTLQSLPDRIKARLALRFDAVERRKYLDMRTALIACLFARSPKCRKDVLAKAKGWQPELSSFERALVVRLLK